MYYVFAQVMYLFYQRQSNQRATIRAQRIVSQLKKTTNGTNWNTCTNWTGEAETERMDETKK